MSASWTDWPALRHAGVWHAVSCSQAVWGKAKGTTKEFGWIARSPSFDHHQPPIETRLKLGSEDRHVAASFWKVDGDRCVAMYVYPSPVVDATGQRGLEKQFVECRLESLPAAGVAAALLVEARELAGKSRLHDIVLSRNGGVVPLMERTVDVPGRLDTVVHGGVDKLRAAVVSRQALVDFYWRILARSRPAMLQVESPLPPDALAALLLPLERSRADALSIAGWIVSNRFDDNAMRVEWDGIVYETVPREFSDVLPDPALRPQAEALAAMLLDPRPARDAGRAESGGLPPVASERRSVPSPDISVLIDFARSPERSRRFRPPRPAHIGDDVKRELEAALQGLRDEFEADADVLDAALLEARQRHLQAKADRIKRVALQISPTFADINWRIE